MKRMAIYVRNGEINPSSYYRIMQYVDGLPCDCIIHNLTSNSLYNLSINLKNKFMRYVIKGLLCIEIIVKSFFSLLYDYVNNIDIIFVQREIVPRYTPFPIRLIERKLFSDKFLIWDVDDDIFISGEVSKRENILLQDNADVIIFASRYLINTVSCDTKKILVLPTTDGNLYNNIDLKRALARRMEVFEHEISLIWIGTTGNLTFLESIIPQLDEFALKTYKKVYLYVISGRKLSVRVKKLIIINVSWSRKTIADIVMRSHIGLMPLPDNQFTRGKGGFKLIQYLSGGLPVCGSNVGINVDIIHPGIGYLIHDNNWISPLLQMTKSKDMYYKMAQNAIREWESKYSYSYVLDELSRIIKDSGEKE